MRGWRFITVDFRLLPPVHARDIRDDVQAAFRFIAYELPQVDSKHIVVAGTSGGGYPAQLAALYAEPKPAGLLLLYGLGLHFLVRLPLCFPNRTLRWAFQQTPHFLERHTKSFWQGRPILNLDEWRCWLPPACFDEPPLTGYKPEDDHRASLTQFYMQEAVFLDVLFHQVGLGERLRVEGKVALDEETRTLLPELQAATRFPSTFLIHGADDTILLAEDSRLMHERLRGAGIKTALRIVPNAGHAFDYSPDQEEHVRGVLDFFEL